MPVHSYHDVLVELDLENVRNERLQLAARDVGDGSISDMICRGSKIDRVVNEITDLANLAHRAPGANQVIENRRQSVSGIRLKAIFDNQVVIRVATNGKLCGRTDHIFQELSLSVDDNETDTGEQDFLFVDLKKNVW